MNHIVTIVILVYCLVAGGCMNQPAEKVLFDFETDADLDRFGWRCHTLFSISHDHATHGVKSLKFEIFPAQNPGMTPVDMLRDWKGYGSFCFDVYNIQDYGVYLEVRVDDRDDNPDHSDRYQGKFLIKPGANTVCLSSESLITSGTKRKMNLRTIYLVDIFMTAPEKRLVLHFDYFRLVPVKLPGGSGANSRLTEAPYRPSWVMVKV